MNNLPQTAVLAFSLALATTGGSAQAQCLGSWVDAAPSTPEARLAPAIAYNPGLGTVSLFGGALLRPSGGAEYLGSTLAIEREPGWHWVEIANVGPSPRGNCRMVTDTARGRIVLFGGANATTSYNDTWILTGSQWAQLAIPGPLPAPRENAAMTYDAARDRVIIFGGNAGSSMFGDTWEFDGTSWTQRASTGPAARTGAAIAFDPIRNRSVLHGGVDSTGISRGDTWEWNGAAWTEVTPLSAPNPWLARYSPALEFDPAVGRLLLIGGVVLNPGGTFYQSSTCSWNGTSWTLFNNGLNVTPRDLVRAAHSPPDRGIVMYGGRSADGPLGVLSDTNVLVLHFPQIINTAAGPERCLHGTLELAVSAAAFGDSYALRWRRNGQPLNDQLSASGARISGSTTNYLRIESTTTAESGVYDCVVTSACGSATSEPVTVRICIADANCSGSVSFEDLFAYLSRWFFRGLDADVNQDRMVTLQDLFDYLAAYFNNC